MSSRLEVVRAIAAAHLPEGIRQKWLELLRPAVRLVPAGAADPVVARLGGLPSVPASFTWPVWDGCGPLSYIGEIHLEAVAAYEDDGLPVPTAGRILFFYFDGSYDGGLHIVYFGDEDTAAGARAVPLPRSDADQPRAAPDGVTVYPERSYTGRQIITAPGWEHPDLQEAFRAPGTDLRAFMDHPVCGEAFQEALRERLSGPAHQIGGYADPAQGPVESEIAASRLPAATWESEEHAAEAAQWELLLQVDSDHDLRMMWGDVGILYWLARPGDLRRGDLTNISFTWQCG